MRKYSQAGPAFLADELDELGDRVENEGQQPGIPTDQSENTLTDVSRGLDPEQRDIAERNAKAQMAYGLLQEIQSGPQGSEIVNRLKSDPDFVDFVRTIQTEADPSFFQGLLEQHDAQGIVEEMQRTTDLQTLAQRVRSRASSIARQLQENKNQRSPMQPVAFNLSRFKNAQVSSLTQSPANEGQFIETFLPELMAYDGKKQGGDQRSEQARQQILKMVSPVAIQEVDSAIEAIQQCEIHKQEYAAELLRYIHSNWIAPRAIEVSNSEQVTMAKKNPKGIIKFNLSDHVLNNKKAGLDKTAAQHFGTPYILYGPTEKRICPKLRGRGGGQPGSADVVSEEICRFHCLDGIVIDDNKTICGEALWRSTQMDKFSREYVDADGNIVGGYLNKRFEINRNVPEENKIRLKPGETRKPRPPEWGSLESRMQAMRNKEANDRNFRPNSNTGEPFNWTKDVDQNNVEQTQSERDRRETATGHEIVQYTNKSKQENKPKTAGFNLHNFKKAQGAGIPVVNDGRPVEPSQEQVELQDRNAVWRHLTEKQKNKKKTRAAGFNLKQYKFAQINPDFEQEKFDAGTGKDRISQMSDEALRFTLNDLNEVIQVQEQAMREGNSTPKLGYYYDERFAILEEMKRRGLQAGNNTAIKSADSPPGWEHTVEHMKEHHSDEIDNPFALAWYMRNKGYTPHKNEKNKHKENKDTKKDQAIKKKLIAQTNNLQSVFQRGRDFVDPDRAPSVIPYSIQSRLNALKREISQQSHSSLRYKQLATEIQQLKDRTKTNPAQSKPAKPLMFKEVDEVSPALLRLFKHDTDEATAFMECCNDDELRIIQEEQDPNRIQQIRIRIQNDIEDTAKDLAMDD